LNVSSLIFISLESWDDIWRRNQFVCAELARRHPETKILFVSPAHDVSNHIRRGHFHKVFERTCSCPGEFHNIQFAQPLKILPNTLAAGRSANSALFRSHLRKMVALHKLQNAVLWINDHAAHHLVGTLGESAVIYDITDDWTSLTQSPRLAARIREQDAALSEKADAIIACSKRLYEMKSRFFEKLHVVPNGVDVKHYATVADRSLSMPAATRSWSPPVFGYTGTIHPDRVDVSLLQHLAAALPRATLSLVGPNHLPPATMAALARHQNLVFTGPVAYTEIPDYMRAFDVCMTPHRVTAFTESLNPIKLWEYLAAGKPIVSTDVAAFRDYPEHVRIARGVEEFKRALWEAYAEAKTSDGWAKAEARRAEARKHSWSSRVDQIEAVIESVFSEKSGKLAYA
jgi:teichuronic acid biosynthesis glycosyltransferase TuaH